MLEYSYLKYVDAHSWIDGQQRYPINSPKDLKASSWQERKMSGWALYLVQKARNITINPEANEWKILKLDTLI